MILRLLASVLLVFACGVAADSTTVYRFVDGNGVVVFSDTPPPPGVSAETLQIVAPVSAAADSQQQLEAMRQTTDRMVSDRQEREALRELVRLRAAAEARQRPAPREQVRHEYIYLPAPTMPPWRRGYHSPPHRPQDPSRLGIIPGPNSQLMRPILSRPRD